jgi:sarcosine oxidase subunit beta
LLPHVVVIGSGILGVSTAFHLGSLGERHVVVLERHCLSAGATGRSGALIRSNYDNRDDARLGVQSLEVFRNWHDRIGGTCDFHAVGALQLGDYQSQCPLPQLVAQQRQWGVDISLVDIAAAKELAPRLRLEHLSEPITYEAGAGHCDPNLANRTMYGATRDRGVEFIFGEAVTSITTRSGRAVGVTTTKRSLPAGNIVLATGVWANQLLGPLGLDFGLAARLSRLAVFRPPEFEEHESFPAILDGNQEAWFRSLRGGQVMVGAERGGVAGIDPASVPDAAPQGVVEAYREILAYRFAVSPHAAPRGSWAGAYMTSPDLRPVIGKIATIDNLYLACGDNGTSFKIAPAVGLGLAELILFGEGRAVDLSSLCPSRFDTLRKRAVASFD